MKKQPVELPADIKGKYRLSRQLFGGPVFDFPHLSLYRVNLSTLTEVQAERLIKAGWTGLARIEKKDKVAPAAVPDTAQQ